ncbi:MULTISPECIES: GrpB family protein [unclassified Peribacillus]|uniref:GrpB family protein n=1 Tax=unclassified Peribacillus TaxID=2675266 RepID=UPI00191245DC|nr:MULTISPECIES: GrpB family protein [unclassified Peribacillus]MBK5445064.1 GrpB family protein [Peribacillus sp. TH24]MBK5460215.1 GrpB family protein [Peribacillus sp. TH27]MBK5482027.1 GrpB family protein [Peribacillus sp. TH16]MBK5498406.1 GrpB family protein [Peribacillus sp. TH14]WMX56484.1 GrpB family protein [Peribacillus sp. R9-11]
MEQVNFLDNSQSYENVEKAFLVHKKIIKELLEEADIQHIGSTAIPNCLTKGDLDIQVRVIPEHFSKAVQALSQLYELNDGSVKTSFFRSFKDDTKIPPLGVQLSVIDSEYDYFWKFRDVLLRSDAYRMEYDELKRKYEGKNMDEYREAKNEFFQRLMKTPEFNNL